MNKRNFFKNLLLLSLLPIKSFACEREEYLYFYFKHPETKSETITRINRSDEKQFLKCHGFVNDLVRCSGGWINDKKIPAVSMLVYPYRKENRVDIYEA